MPPVTSKAHVKPHPTSDDAALLDRVRSGEASAFETLVQVNWAPLVGYAARIVGDVDAAEDVVQEALVRFWERRAEWRPKSEARAILYTITRNLGLTHRQAQSARERRASRLPTGSIPVPRTPIQDLDQHEADAALESAIQALPPRRREVLILARFNGLSYRLIAEIMKISVPTVANHMSAALADLDRALSEYLS